MSIYLSIYLSIHLSISTTPARLLHHTIPPHAPPPPVWMDADLRRGVLGENGRGEGADCGGVRHQSSGQGTADDGPCLGARLPLLSRAGRLAALAQTHGGGDSSSISACSAFVSVSSLTNVCILRLCNFNISRKIPHFHHEFLYICTYIYIYIHTYIYRV
jgi:hypothetical protein